MWYPLGASGDFRIQYVIDDEQRTVTLRRVKAHSDVYGLS